MVFCNTRKAQKKRVVKYESMNSITFYAIICRTKISKVSIPLVHI
jgi:hypothetical protein